MAFVKSENNVMYRRIVIIGGVVLAAGAILLMRLWYVQIIKVHTLAGEASEQSIRRIRVSPTRGRIFDRQKRLLVDNRPSYDIVLRPAAMRQPGGRQKTIDFAMSQARKLGEVIGRSVEIKASDIKRHLRVRPPVPLRVFGDLSKLELSLAAEHLPNVRGVEIKLRYRRDYAFPGLGGHILGFTGRRRPPDELRNKRYSYVMPEPRGRTGLELYYDEELAGRPGMRMVRVDPTGYIYEGIGRSQPPRDGGDLILTIDAQAQRIAENLLEGYKGAVVVVDAQNGAVIAMASSPTYNLADLSSAEYGRLAADEDSRPLVNRAIAGGYLPGSIIKPLVGLAALENGAVEADHEVVCTGQYPIGDGIGCWLRSGHGTLDMEAAIEQSCNSYFIDIGLKTGLDQLRPMFLDAGLGSAPNLDLYGVGAGLVPSRSWARQYYGRPWIAIDTAFLSIGQGAIGLSPLQAALYAAAIGNGGQVYRPFLVQKIVDSEGEALRQTAPLPASTLTVSDKNLQVIRQGMKKVVNGEHGSAGRAQTEIISLAGKTGTAEVQTPSDEHNNTWFIGYGPLPTPRYAICVLVEYGASGGRTAAPLARKFFDNWLSARP
ncbi:MAG: penicillin-binding protein 2 [Lentisphaeria bacterium]